MTFIGMVCHWSILPDPQHTGCSADPLPLEMLLERVSGMLPALQPILEKTSVLKGRLAGRFRFSFLAGHMDTENL